MKKEDFIKACEYDHESMLSFELEQFISDYKNHSKIDIGNIFQEVERKKKELMDNYFLNSPERLSAIDKIEENALKDFKHFELGFFDYIKEGFLKKYEWHIKPQLGHKECLNIKTNEIISYYKKESVWFYYLGKKFEVKLPVNLIIFNTREKYFGDKFETSYTHQKINDTNGSGVYEKTNEHRSLKKDYKQWDYITTEEEFFK